MKRFRQRPLTRELTVVIVVKLALIITLKLVFFSDAVKPDSEEVARALLAAPAQRNPAP